MTNNRINERINSKIIEIANDIECENNVDFVQHENANIFVQYENANKQSESDLERLSLNVSRNELNDLPFKNKNENDFEDDFSM